MLKTIAFVIFSLIAGSAQAAESVTCTMTSTYGKTKGKSVSATVLVRNADDGGEFSEGLNVKKDNYNFLLEINTNGAQYEVNAIFYENNSVQDEVSSMRCKFTRGSRAKVFCKEPLLDDAGKVSEFSCVYSPR
jgi:hypothetical protein